MGFCYLLTILIIFYLIYASSLSQNNNKLFVLIFFLYSYQHKTYDGKNILVFIIKIYIEIKRKIKGYLYIITKLSLLS